jgi:hypothetical protein
MLFAWLPAALARDESAEPQAINSTVVQTLTRAGLGVVAIQDLADSSGRPLSSSALLAVNTEDAVRDVTALDERDGVGQLRELVNTSSFEEEWAYLVDYRLWVEVGSHEVIDPTTGPQVEVDEGLLALLLQRFPRIHLYQIHPEGCFEAGFGRSPPPATTPVASLSEKDLVTAGLALPSPYDVDAAVSIALLQQQIAPASEVNNFVVSPYGLIEFEPTPAARKQIAYEHGDPRAGLERSLVTIAAIRRAPYNITRTVAENPTLSIGGLIAELCLQMTSENFRTTLVATSP